MKTLIVAWRKKKLPIFSTNFFVVFMFFLVKRKGLKRENLEKLFRKAFRKANLILPEIKFLSLNSSGIV